MLKNFLMTLLVHNCSCAETAHHLFIDCPINIHGVLGFESTWYSSYHLNVIPTLLGEDSYGHYHNPGTRVSFTWLDIYGDMFRGWVFLRIDEASLCPSIVRILFIFVHSYVFVFRGPTRLITAKHKKWRPWFHQMIPRLSPPATTFGGDPLIP